MSLTIHYDSNITNLAKKLKDELIASREALKDHPFTFIDVAVPNRLMEKWLRVHVFAEAPTLSAGIQFPFIEKYLTDHLLKEFPTEEKDIGLMPLNSYTYGIMKLLTDTEKIKEEFKPFYRYIFGKDEPQKIKDVTTARKAWQLSQKLADLIDTYEVHRDDLLNGWLGEEKENSSDEPVQKAEKALTQALFNEQDGLFPGNGKQLSLRQIYKQAEKKEKASGSSNNTANNPSMFLFGYSTITQLHAKILQFLAKKYDIHYFFFNVCKEYWGDISKKVSDSEEKKIENDLLNTFGMTGRKSIDILTSSEGKLCQVNELKEDTSTKKTDTVLHAVQTSIRHRTMELPVRIEQDASLQIVGASGIRREVEMLYNSILASVATNSNNRCEYYSDIAVWIPDLNTYLPSIEYVFKSRGRIPYNIIDMTAGQTSLYLQAFNDLIALHRKGITRETLFPLLENPIVARALHYSVGDVATWREIAEKYGAFDYYDKEDMEGHGRANAEHFTWEWALKRLRREAISKEFPADDGINLELKTMNVGATELQFSTIVEKLYRVLKNQLGEKGTLKNQLGEKGTLKNSKNWKDAFGKIMETFLKSDEDDALEQSVCGQIFHVLNVLQDGKYKMPAHSYDVEVEAINMFVNGIICSKGRNVGGVTIGRLGAMRPIPYKQVYILGLGEGGFPGEESHSTLDLRALGVDAKELSGTSVPDVNRYAFLETLMAVQDRLVLSYQEKDICEDADLFPSSVVRCVKDFVEKYILEDKERFQTIHLPLLERDIKCLNAETSQKDYERGILQTFAKDAYDIAKKKYDNDHPSGTQTEQTTQTQTEQTTQTQTEQTTTVEAVQDQQQRGSGITTELDAKTMAEFLIDPLDCVLKHDFGIGQAQYKDKTIETETPLEMNAFDQWDIQQNLIEYAGNNNEEQLTKEIKRKQLTGKVPEGYLGKFAEQKFTDMDMLSKHQEFYKNFNAKNSDKNSVYKDIVYCHKNEQPDFPPQQCLPILMESLTKIASKSSEQDNKNFQIRIAVICYQKKKKQKEEEEEEEEDVIWTWYVTPKEVREYLAEIKNYYNSFLSKKNQDGQFICVGYDDVLNVFSEVPDIKRALKEVDDDDLQQAINLYKRPDYKTLVIENVVSEKRGWPDNGSDFAKICKDLFQLPLSAQKETGDQQKTQEEGKENE